MTMRLALTILLAVILAFCAGAGSAHEGDADEGGRAPEKLGQVDFPTSCASSVQPLFERGVALLHSFWFPEGLKVFNEVLKRDPSCTVAYWGIGVNRLLNPFGGQAAEAVLLQGQQAVEQGISLGAKTVRERDYLGAIAAFYTRDRATWRERAQRYERAMDELASRYPDDREAAIFYALALNIAADPADKTYARQLKAARILEPIFAAQPEHPGVAHYLIHSYDYPPIADKGLPAARRYADIAPAAAHALHMPSHIFTRVGAWEDSIAANLRSEAVARKNNTPDEMLHALDYQVYAALQVAKDTAARDSLRRVEAEAPRAERIAGYYSLAAGPARYALERADWKAAAQLAPLPGKFANASAMTRFARAYGAARSGDAAAAGKDLLELARLRDVLLEAKDAYWAGEVEVQRLAASAWIELAKGNRDEALSQMRKAAGLEDASEKSPVSPGRVLPARELLGEMLLELKQPAQALKEFETSALRDPNRFRGYYGAALAAMRSGDSAKAKAYFARLSKLAAKGDPRPELEQAKTFIAAN